MIDKEKVITKICDAGIVAVVRAESSEQALKIADACIEGGVAAIEMTFTVPGAHKVIEDLAKTYTKGEIILGAGTVMDSETARIAILSGAQYVVSPYFNAETVRLCNRYRIPCMPGAMTIKEVVEAMEAGADIIKLFPGEAFGPKIIKAIKGPIPYAKLMPTGGVSVDNVGEWIKAGAVAVGAGGALTSGAKTGDYASITRIGKEFVAKIKEARGV
ncbi:MAG: 2-dehydro-3-deoxyphosphogluconate aldolase / (4S)-4-hydroxy-2-oxoglutarate aldolase [Clostridiales bacterium]|jgi:2-dehydro-3-deoxyphosphogluconate aldolase/(4S)-4-hydroxy-2-oxoglutarate aldolase|nr:2-dehydro-3-deoxyphosphogluconate aldolase / (4S)-4-hydroxy-2-oxoglutarate aldolase [Clostridiales bacterium]MDK2933784.1 2-dehydro-3-deoxyphosphogluconate aldolase / (4S)-4-hydroxy-2-oxoglutarate aldolase [Clostridiales bacterium]